MHVTPHVRCAKMLAAPAHSLYQLGPHIFGTSEFTIQTRSLPTLKCSFTQNILIAFRQNQSSRHITNQPTHCSVVSVSFFLAIINTVTFKLNHSSIIIIIIILISLSCCKNSFKDSKTQLARERDYFMARKVSDVLIYSPHSSHHSQSISLAENGSV